MELNRQASKTAVHSGSQIQQLHDRQPYQERLQSWQVANFKPTKWLGTFPVG